MKISGLNIEDYTYSLPEEKIAQHPPKNRSDSKLLHYHEGKIEHRSFKAIPDLIPTGTLLVFNDTRVIPARLIFQKETGARIEIFLLEPLSPTLLYEEAMAITSGCTWHCMIGNARKWKHDQPLTARLKSGTILTATRLENEQVRFAWDSEEPFSEVLIEIGTIPLPPYLHREATEEDVPRYQTVYSHYEGAVAAPTAGLHFTEEILGHLVQRGVDTAYVTLHVSSGTFQPIKAATVEAHTMHREQVLVHLETVDQLLRHTTTYAVGTTSMRTLESLYWFGVQLEEDPEATFFIEKLLPYQNRTGVTPEKSLQNVKAYMIRHQLKRLVGYTEIFIFPGYRFRICKGLITNYHLPGSTLILLVAAFVGEDWQEIYRQALENDYRFLSYGDCSLLVPDFPHV